MLKPEPPSTVVYNVGGLVLHSRSVIRSVWLFPYKVVLLQVNSCHENYSSYDTDYSVKMNRIDSVTAESGEITWWAATLTVSLNAYTQSRSVAEFQLQECKDSVSAKVCLLRWISTAA